MTAPILDPLFLPLLDVWSLQAAQRTAKPTPHGQPWWLSPTFQMNSLENAARTTGWRVHAPKHPEDDWGDLHLTQAGHTYAVRCISLLQSIDSESDGKDVLKHAARLAQVDQDAGRTSPGRQRVQWLFVIPYIRADDGNDAQVRRLLRVWLAGQPLQAAAHAWVGATDPVHRNAAGWAFPGVWLLMQPLRGPKAKS